MTATIPADNQQAAIPHPLFGEKLLAFAALARMLPSRTGGHAHPATLCAGARSGPSRQPASGSDLSASGSAPVGTRRPQPWAGSWPLCRLSRTRSTRPHRSGQRANNEGPQRRQVSDLTRWEFDGHKKPTAPTLAERGRRPTNGTGANLVYSSATKSKTASRNGTGHQHARYRVVRKRVSSLKPSPENSKLYRPTGDDPDIESLAESIKKHGLNEPLIVTADNYVVSGHRRHAALTRIGQAFAPCRVLPVRRDSMTADEYVCAPTRAQSAAQQDRRRTGPRGIGGREP